MWKTPASVLCGCLAALPLIGCVGDIRPPSYSAVASPAVVAQTSPYTYASAPRIYGPAAPAAVLVFLPGDEFLPRDPALWAAQGFDVVTPTAADLYRLAADREAAIERLIASTETQTGAPVWLVGPGPLIEAALTLPEIGRGGVSGFVMTSITTDTGSCSESVFYADPGTGAAPKVEIRRSGDCGTSTPAVGGRHPSVLPTPQQNRPRIIEASAAPKDMPASARVHRLARLIKQGASG